MTFHVIGHVTRDRIVSGSTTREQPGGGAYHAALTLARLGAEVEVITRLAADDRPALLRELHAAGTHLTVGLSPATTTFENTWLDAAFTRRAQAVTAVAMPFGVADLPATDVILMYLAPLLATDMDTRFMECAAARGVVALDAQGMVRQVEGETGGGSGPVVARPWEDAATALPWLSFLKVDAGEAAVLTGQDDPVRAARQLARRLGRAPREAIVSLAERGAVIASPQRTHHIAALPTAQWVDATGCGDTFFAAYLLRRHRGNDIPAAGRFAAACATLTLERFGAFPATEPDVDARLAASES